MYCHLEQPASLSLSSGQYRPGTTDRITGFSETVEVA